MTTVTPYQSSTKVGHDSFGQSLRAEWTKFRTVRGWMIGMAVAAVVTVGIGLLGAAGSSISCVGPNGQKCADHTPPLGPGGEPVSDAFYYVHQPLAGDGVLTVRLTSLTGRYSPFGGGPESGMVSGTQPWSKAGILLKENTSEGSAYAAMMVTGSHGVRMQYDYVNDIAGLPGQVSGASPRWLRLTRSGDTVTGYESLDGTTWAEVGAAKLPGLASTVQIGMFAASPDYVVTSDRFGGTSSSGGPSLATGDFDDVGLQGAGLGGSWAGIDMAGRFPDGGPATGYQPTSAGFTVTGSGDIAPGVAGAGGGGKTVEDGLVGAFAGLIALVVVATLTITSEYRRGLIRVTLAASPRRGRVLAAKAVVVGAASFVTGLIASAVALPLVRGIERGKGYFVFPASTATEVRVVVGTAALLAVAAVFALAVGTVLRRSAVAVAAVIVVIVLPYILAVASVLPSGASEWLTRLTPAAAFAVQQTVRQYPQVVADYSPTSGYFPLAPWAGFAVLCVYTAAALGLAAFLLRRRDA